MRTRPRWLATMVALFAVAGCAKHRGLAEDAAPTDAAGADRTDARDTGSISADTAEAHDAMDAHDGTDAAVGAADTSAPGDARDAQDAQDSQDVQGASDLGAAPDTSDSAVETAADANAPDGSEAGSGFVVTAIQPSDAMTGVDPGVAISIDVSNDIKAASVATSSVHLLRGSTPVTAVVALTSLRRVTLTPKAPLALLATYTVQIDDTVQDTSGHALSGQRSAVFTVRDGSLGATNTLTVPGVTLLSLTSMRAAGGPAGDFGIAVTSSYQDTFGHAPQPFGFAFGALGWEATKLDAPNLSSSAPAETIDIAVDDAGNFCVAWGYYDAVYSVERLGGAQGGWTAYSSVIGSGYQPRVAIVAPNTWGVAFQINTNVQGFAYQTYQFDKTAAMGYVTLTTDPYDWGSSTIASAPRVSTAAVAWTDTKNLLSQVWADTSQKFGTAVAVSDPRLKASAPQIAMDPSGNASLIWVQANPTSTDLMASRHGLGGAWSTPVPVSDGKASVAGAAIGADASGNFVAVWQEPVAGVAQVFAARWLAATGVLTSPAQISDGSASAAAPALAVDLEGNAIATWGQASGTRTDVWAARLAGGSWKAASRASDGVGSTSLWTVAVDGLGRGFVVWSQASAAGPVVRRFD
jgi:hypothetical protein